MGKFHLQVQLRAKCLSLVRFSQFHLQFSLKDEEESVPLKEIMEDYYGEPSINSDDDEDDGYESEKKEDTTDEDDYNPLDEYPSDSDL
ncbi:hypothetical protein FRX31_013550 [Thalictrum thalictroides]|uniref:Uncharacterized protein n=1 Tax=Thalictrum thalictroides TaxID=46969 RepID=A0A7J6WIQ1_THATH|nr:hypothetical protein FRX31_013550 [Thalictrum thalictroides]